MPLNLNANHKLGAQSESELCVNRDGSQYRLFWGDLHNHNAVGYAKGSLRRSIDLAREHLDFFAFTGHASWHDMPKMPGDRHMHWVNGFKAHSEHWPKTKQMIQEANTDDFVALLGYEWHSSFFGDFCVVYPDDGGELFLPDHADKLLDHAQAAAALAIPHHVGYKHGWRGANWDFFRSTTAPVVEIFSEHGCTESVRSPFPMLRHSNGGRWMANLIDRQLKQGTRFGFVASTDDHRGYPGAYGEGIVGVWSNELSRPALFEAIRSRRTFAATGDRIALEVSLNDQPMGSELDFVDDRLIDVRVTGQDAIHMVELIRNGRVIERYFPEDAAEAVTLPGIVKCRIQYGWGPWADLDLGRICDWEATVRIENGRFLRALPCFQAAPFDEDRRDRLRMISETELHLSSSTSRVGSYGEDPTKAIVIELEGSAHSDLSIELTQPSSQTINIRLEELIDNNLIEFTGVFTTESLVVGPLVSPTEYTTRIQWNDRRTQPDETDWYYVRVTQRNGQMAWSSPIWVG